MSDEGHNRRKCEEKTLSANLADERELSEKENKMSHSHELTETSSQSETGTQKDRQHQSTQTGAGGTAPTGAVEIELIEMNKSIKQNKNVPVRTYNARLHVEECTN